MEDAQEEGTKSLPQRKRPACQPVFESGNLSPIIFLTVCTKDRKPSLAKPDVHRLLVNVWNNPTNHWLVGRYALMPDHLHLFCSPRRLDSLGVKEWAKYWKSEASRQWPRPAEHPVWQINCWDTQLRKGQSYSEK